MTERNRKYRRIKDFAQNNAEVRLKRNWARSILTILGISGGVGAFISVAAIGNAGSSIEKQLQNLGDTFIWIEPAGK